MVEYVVGTQVVEFVATACSMHVVITTISSMMGPGVIISVSTIGELLKVETTEVPKRVAVGVGWHAMRNYFVNFKVVQSQCAYGVAVVFVETKWGKDVRA